MDQTEPAATMFIGNERAQALWERMLKLRADAIQRSKAIDTAHSAQLQQEKTRALERYTAIQRKREESRRATLDRLTLSMQKRAETEAKMRGVVRRVRADLEQVEAMVLAGYEERMGTGNNSTDEARETHAEADYESERASPGSTPPVVVQETPMSEDYYAAF